MTTIAQHLGLQDQGPNPKKKPWRSKKWRDAAKGQNCTMRLPGCQNDIETVVLAHRNGAGMGTKSDDYDAADMCQHCHDIYDGRKKMIADDSFFTAMALNCGSISLEDDFFEEAKFETIANRLERGILK